MTTGLSHLRQKWKNCFIETKQTIKIKITVCSNSTFIMTNNKYTSIYIAKEDWSSNMNYRDRYCVSVGQKGRNGWHHKYL